MLVISTITMYVFYCDLCERSTQPLYSSEIPYEWEETTFNGKAILVCPSHMYGITPKERAKLEGV
jgi:hypothetical protein